MKKLFLFYLILCYSCFCSRVATCSKSIFILLELCSGSSIRATQIPVRDLGSPLVFGSGSQLRLDSCRRRRTFSFARVATVLGQLLPARRIFFSAKIWSSRGWISLFLLRRWFFRSWFLVASPARCPRQSIPPWFPCSFTGSGLRFDSRRVHVAARILRHATGSVHRFVRWADFVSAVKSLFLPLLFTRQEHRSRRRLAFLWLSS
jgi:hypothetical protein